MSLAPRRGPAASACEAAEAAFEAGVRAAERSDPLAALVTLAVGVRPFAWEGLASALITLGQADGWAALAADPVRAPFAEVGRGVAAGFAGAAAPLGEWAADGHGFGVGYTRGERALRAVFVDGSPLDARRWHLRGVGRAAWFWTRGSPTGLQGALSLVGDPDLDAVLDGVAFAAVFTRSDPSGLAALVPRGSESLRRGAARGLSARLVATGS